LHRLRQDICTSGRARAALFNYLYARQKGGKFLLRIEDTDLARSTEESTRSYSRGLEWLGLAPDERIRFSQSNNAAKHRDAAKKLLAEGKAYRDFTPKEERPAIRASKQSDRRPRSFR
jgi:glutamyl-tRNA synthetase